MAESWLADQVTRSGTPEVVAYLQDLLGQRLTAVIAGVSNATAVGQWARGERTPHPGAEQRLRAALQVAELLLAAESPETVRSWFVGMNPDLDDQTPVLALGDEPTRVLQAARTFLAHG